jgi:hypothetical protein
MRNVTVSPKDSSSGNNEYIDWNLASKTSRMYLYKFNKCFIGI